MHFVRNSTSRLQILARFKRSVPHYYDQSTGQLVFSRKNQIFAIPDLSNPKPNLLGEIPWTFWQRASDFRLADRFLKRSIQQLCLLPKQGWLVITGNEWWHLGFGKEASPVMKVGPTRPMSRGVCAINDCVYVAEYIRNRERAPVRVFRSRDFRTFETAWEFPAKAIRHVHAVIADLEIRGRIWVLTGDLDHESHFFYTDDDFASLRKLISLGQRSRAVDLIQRRDTLLWGMDAPDETSSILSVNVADPAAVTNHGTLPGPAYYACRNQAGGLYLGTTAERGAAVVKEGWAHIVGLSPNGTWESILSSRKSFGSHGIFYFPRGNLPENFIAFSQRALTPGEGHMTIARDLAWASG